jgi:hypothetical protein
MDEDNCLLRCESTRWLAVCLLVSELADKGQLNELAVEGIDHHDDPDDEEYEI